MEWLCLWANATLAQDAKSGYGHSIFFMAGGTGSNSLSIVTSLDPEHGVEAVLKGEFNVARERLLARAKEKEWDWLKVIHRPPALGTGTPSEGDQLYVPTRLEWLSLLANTTGGKNSWAKYGYKLEFRPGPVGSDCVLVRRFVDSKADAALVDRELKSITAAVYAVARQKQWEKWFKIQPADEAPEASEAGEGDQEYQPTKIEWVTALANATLRTDAWDESGIGIRFRPSEQDGNAVHIDVTADARRVGPDDAEKVIHRLGTIVTMVAEQKEWDWLKVRSGKDRPVDAGEHGDSPTVATFAPRLGSNNVGEAPQSNARLEYLATTANTTLARNVWDAEGYVVSVVAGELGSETIHIVITYDAERVNAKSLANYVRARARDNCGFSKTERLVRTADSETRQTADRYGRRLAGRRFQR